MQKLQESKGSVEKKMCEQEREGNEAFRVSKKKNSKIAHLPKKREKGKGGLEEMISKWREEIEKRIMLREEIRELRR